MFAVFVPVHTLTNYVIVVAYHWCCFVVRYDITIRHPLK